MGHHHEQPRNWKTYQSLQRGNDTNKRQQSSPPKRRFSPAISSMTGEEIGRTPPRRERRLRTPTTKDFAPISNKLHTDPTQPGLGSDNGLAATSPVRHGKEKCHEKLVRESAPPELAKLASSTQIRPALPQEPAQKKGGRPMTERRGSGSEEALVVQPITVPTPSEPTLHNHAAQGLQQPPHQVAVTHRPHGTTTVDELHQSSSGPMTARSSN